MASDEISILVVEDEPAIAELIAFSIKSAGWRPVTVFSVSYTHLTLPTNSLV